MTERIRGTVQVEAAVDRIVIAATDYLIDGGPNAANEANDPAVVVADQRAIHVALAAATADGSAEQVASRLYWWARASFTVLVVPDPGAPWDAPLYPLPNEAQPTQVTRVWNRCWETFRRDVDRGADDLSVAPGEWTELLSDGAEVADLLWTAASLVVLLQDLHDEGLANLLDQLDRELPHGNLAWSHQAGVTVERPERHRFRAFFDEGTDLLWSNDDASRARFDYPVNHDELPIPRRLGQRIDAAGSRHDATIPVRGPHLPLEGDELDQFKAEYRSILEDLRSTLGPAYTIVDEAGIL